MVGKPGVYLFFYSHFKETYKIQPYRSISIQQYLVLMHENFVMSLEIYSERFNTLKFALAYLIKLDADLFKVKKTYYLAH